MENLYADIYTDNNGGRTLAIYDDTDSVSYIHTYDGRETDDGWKPDEGPSLYEDLQSFGNGDDPTGWDGNELKDYEESVNNNKYGPDTTVLEVLEKESVEEPYMHIERGGAGQLGHKLASQKISDAHAVRIGEDFLAKYDLDQGDAGAERGKYDNNLYMSVQASNGTTLNLLIPEDKTNPQDMAEAFMQTVEDFNPDEELAANFDWDQDYRYWETTPSEALQNLQEDKTELTLKAAQAMQDAGLTPKIDADMTALDVKMSVSDFANMLQEAGVPPTPGNILQAAQGNLAGRDGYYLAGYAAQQGAEMLKEVVRDGRANEDYGLDMTGAEKTREQQKTQELPKQQAPAPRL